MPSEEPELVRSTGWRRRSAILALATGSLSVIASSSGRAAQVMPSDCAFGFQEQYETGEVVCATGDVDPHAGEGIFPTGLICVTANRVWSNGDPVEDVTLGGCNLVVG